MSQSYRQLGLMFVRILLEVKGVAEKSHVSVFGDAFAVTNVGDAKCANRR